MRIKPLNLWTFLVNSSMKKSSDSIALIRNNLSNFKQNLPIFRLFQAASQKWMIRPTVWCNVISSICWFFAKRLIWVGLLSKLWTFISNQRCQFGPISMIQSIFDTFFHLAFDAQILKTILNVIYSPTPNKRAVLNKSVGWIMTRKWINVYTWINVYSGIW